MKVLKFGGTVANAQNIKLVLDIVQNQAKQDQLIVVVSALSKVTDLLHLLFQRKLEKHLDAVKELIAVSEQKSHIKRIINHLETLLDGCFLLGELSNRTSDTILSFESYFLLIIAEALKQNFKNSSYKDSELIKTNSNFGKATVNFKLTNQLITDFFY
jgi:aspartokinase/homoserine dehydrogenase 1